MFRYAGGQTVRHGFYWNADKWQVTLVERQGGDLPGEARERYARVPVLAMLLVAPIMGALYVIFLPLIGFAMVFDYVAGGSRGCVGRARGGRASLAPRRGLSGRAQQEEEEGGGPEDRGRQKGTLGASHSLATSRLV
jgi:hypothetical protein